jgi:hypothetical protein
VPADERRVRIGGAPAHYHYWTSDSFNSKATTGFGQFTADQVANRGRWLNSGSFPVRGGRVDLIVVNTGVDDAGQRVAAAAISLACVQA